LNVAAGGNTLGWSEKGKPIERWGRKASGLRVVETTTAGLPALRVLPISAFLADIETTLPAALSALQDRSPATPISVVA